MTQQSSGNKNWRAELFLPGSPLALAKYMHEEGSEYVPKYVQPVCDYIESIADNLKGLKSSKKYKQKIRRTFGSFPNNTQLENSEWEEEVTDLNVNKDMLAQSIQQWRQQDKRYQLHKEMCKNTGTKTSFKNTYKR